MVSTSSLDRKQRSEAMLREESVPFIPHLPCIEDEETTQIRSLEEVAWRAMALNIVAVKGEGLEQEQILGVIDRYQLMQAFTPKERDFILDENPSEHDRIQFLWRYECYWVLLWALSYVDELVRPDQICDVPQAVRLMVDRSAEQFIADAKLRSVSEILDAADLIYRYDWACVDARVNGQPSPAGLDAGVVRERHYALNWTIGYPDRPDWDNISTDT